MELFRTDTHFIFVRERHNLWCDRFTGELLAKSGVCLNYFLFVIFSIVERTAWINSTNVHDEQSIVLWDERMRG